MPHCTPTKTAKCLNGRKRVRSSLPGDSWGSCKCQDMIPAAIAWIYWSTLIGKGWQDPHQPLFPTFFKCKSVKKSYRRVRLAGHLYVCSQKKYGILIQGNSICNVRYFEFTASQQGARLGSVALIYGVENQNKSKHIYTIICTDIIIAICFLILKEIVIFIIYILIYIKIHIEMIMM